MVQCKCCGKSISPKAQTCPHCGEPAPVPPGPPPPVTLGNVLEAFGIDRSMALWLGAVFLGAGAATWVFYGLRDAQQRQGRSTPASVEADGKSGVSAAAAAPLPSLTNDQPQTANEPLSRR